MKQSVISFLRDNRETIIIKTTVSWKVIYWKAILPFFHFSLAYDQRPVPVVTVLLVVLQRHFTGEKFNVDKELARYRPPAGNVRHR